MRIAISLSLDAETLALIDAIAQEEDRTRSGTIRLLIREAARVRAQREQRGVPHPTSAGLRSALKNSSTS